MKVAQSCPILCDPIDCSLPDSSVHGILQARMLEWVAIPFSRGPSQPREILCYFRPLCYFSAISKKVEILGHVDTYKCPFNDCI